MSRADKLFELRGVEPPRPRFGESAIDFKRRTLAQLQTLLPAGHPVTFVNPYQQSEKAIDGLEDVAVSHAIAEFTAPRGPLRQSVTRDRTGREVVRFYGDPEECWGPFKQQPRRMRFTEGVGRGEDSPQARAAEAAGRAALSEMQRKAAAYDQLRRR